MDRTIIQPSSCHIVIVDDALVDILAWYVLYVMQQQLERGLGVQFVGVREPLKLPLIDLNKRSVKWDIGANIVYYW